MKMLFRSFAGITFGLLVLSACNDHPDAVSVSGLSSSNSSSADVGLNDSWTPHYSDIQGYWPLNGTIGATINDGDTSPAVIGGDGEFNGGGFGYVQGFIAQAVSFSHNGQILMSIENDVIANSFTSIVWFNTTYVADDQKILSQYNAASLIETQPATQTTSTLRVCIGTCGAGTINVADGNWHFVATIGDENGINAYLDGSQTAEVTISSSNINMGTNYAIGSTGSSYPFTGDIDEVALFNVPLSLSDVTTIYNHEIASP